MAWQGREVIGFFALLFVIDWFLYFRHAGHFFQADSTFLLYHRDTSFVDFLGEFIKLQDSGRYCPLTHQLIASLFYPLFGLRPIAYRIPLSWRSQSPAAVWPQR